MDFKTDTAEGWSAGSQGPYGPNLGQQGPWITLRRDEGQHKQIHKDNHTRKEEGKGKKKNIHRHNRMKVPAPEDRATDERKETR